MTSITLGSEQNRTYHYADGSSFTINEPKHLVVLEGGSHRVMASDGRTYRPTPEWLAISWLPRIGEPEFVA